MDHEIGCSLASDSEASGELDPDAGQPSTGAEAMPRLAPLLRNREES
jgi:hypothetical protein